MRLICQVFAVALIIAPAVATSQEDAKLGQKQKAWMVSNFLSGLECSGTSAGGIAGGVIAGRALAWRGQASFDASGEGGIEVTVTRQAGGVPTVTAHAINTKGTGANNGRAAVPSCPAAPSSADVATCTVSGDADAPMVSATIPLSVFGDASASRYVGTVTIVKRTLPTGESPNAAASKRGYDYYKARSDMASAGANANPQLTYLATCDSSALSSKGSKPSVATYDLAVAKK